MALKDEGEIRSGYVPETGSTQVESRSRPLMQSLRRVGQWLGNRLKPEPREVVLEAEEWNSLTENIQAAKKAFNGLYWEEFMTRNNQAVEILRDTDLGRIAFIARDTRNMPLGVEIKPQFRGRTIREVGDATMRFTVLPKTEQTR